MANNLDVSIGIDTAKFRADAAIVKNQMREINKEITAAAKAGDVQGVRTLAAQQDVLARNYSYLTGQIRTATRATDENTAATYASSRSYREASRSVAEFAKSSGLGIEGMKALRFGLGGFVAAEFIRGMKEAIAQLNQLNSAAKAIRADPKQLKEMERGFKETGQAAELAATMLGTYNKLYDAAALKQKMGKGFGSGADVLTGGTQQPTASLQDFLTTARGGQQPNLDALKEDPIRFILGRPLDLKNQAKDWQDIARIIRDVKDATLQNRLAVEAYGLTYEQAKERIAKAAGGAPATESAAQYRARTGFDYGPRPGDTPLGPQGGETPLPGQSRMLPPLKAAADTAAATTELARAQEKALEDYNKTTTAGEDFWRDINTSLGLTVVQAINAVRQLGDLNNILKGAPSVTAPPPRPPGFYAPPADLGSTDGITQVPYASGGYIRGPGSGTSDSILARLSNGEFVMNAGSVRRLGVGFLQGLNSFASGGLVDVPPIRFASGGLAAAGGGNAMASFHFESGNSFKLGGPVDVVNAMVSEAHAQQVRSAGVKPSWYAARPSGL